MKILQQTSTLFVFQDRPVVHWLLGGGFLIVGMTSIVFFNFLSIYVLGGILIIVGGFAIWTPTLTVTFDQTRNHLITEQRGWLGGIEIVQTIENIDQIKLVPVPFFLHQIVLILKSGEHVNLTYKSHLSKTRKRAIVDEIINFLQ